MRIISSSLLACGLCAVATAAIFAQPPSVQPPRPANLDPAVAAEPLRPDGPDPRMKPSEAASIDDFILVPVPVISDQEVAGLAPGSRMELLTWERVYALALVRVRDVRGGFVEAIDPKALDERAARLGVADFDRFRKDFLAAGAVASFRDPSGDYLDLLRRLQKIENAGRNIDHQEGLAKLVAELIQGPSAGLSQLDVHLVSASLQRERQRLADELGRLPRPAR